MSGRVPRVSYSKGGSMNFAPVSCMCLYCKERTLITEPLDEVTCSRCGEVVELVMGMKLGLSRVSIISGEKASNLPVVERKKGDLGVVTLG